MLHQQASKVYGLMRKSQRFSLEQEPFGEKGGTGKTDENEKTFWEARLLCIGRSESDISSFTTRAWIVFEWRGESRDFSARIAGT